MRAFLFPAWAVFLVIFSPQRFIKLAAKHDAEQAEGEMPSGYEAWARYRTALIRRSFTRGFRAVIVTIVGGVLVGVLSARLLGAPPDVVNVGLQLIGAGILLGATITVRGWDIQSIDGNTLAEKVNQWIYRALYVIGTFFLIFAVAGSLCAGK